MNENKGAGLGSHRADLKLGENKQGGNMPFKHIIPFAPVIIYSLLGTSVFLSDAFGQWLRADWKESVLPIECFEVRGAGDTLEYRVVGTGVLIRYKEVNYIVTNKHVAQTPNLSMGLNTKDPNFPIIHYHFDLLKTISNEHWHLSPVFDVAAIRLAYPSNWKDTLDIRSIGVSCIDSSSAVFEGASVYILGFPLGIGFVDQGKYSPVYRGGIIAHKDRNEEFLIDANIFPGNSGGPVFMASHIYEPNTGDFDPYIKASMIGIVRAYIAYSDTAFSKQTQQPRVMFVENSGLAVVVSSDVILEFLEQYSSEK